MSVRACVLRVYLGLFWQCWAAGQIKIVVCERVRVHASWCAVCVRVSVFGQERDKWRERWGGTSDGASRCRCRCAFASVVALLLLLLLLPLLTTVCVGFHRRRCGFTVAAAAVAAVAAVAGCAAGAAIAAVAGGRCADSRGAVCAAVAAVGAAAVAAVASGAAGAAIASVPPYLLSSAAAAMR